MPSLYQKDARIASKLRVLFLGDSVTDNSLYIAYLDAYFRLHRPELDISLIPLGVSSETASGLSEPAHPFPRPCVHDRLAAALREARPDWVVCCYGMNDAIYYPFSEERFAAYREGMLALVKQIRQSGAKAAVMTPPPFDTASFSGHTAPEDAADFSYMKPYEAYDLVLERYSDWLRSLNAETVDGFIDIRTPMKRDIAQRREQDPQYSSGDGIHPNPYGHWVMAATLLGKLFTVMLERMPEYVEAPEESAWFELVKKRTLLLAASWKEHVGHTNPNKSQGAVPLAEALVEARLLEKQLAILAADAEDSLLLPRRTVRDGVRTDEFYLNGRECVVLRPETAAPGNPWVWRTEFLYAFNQADMALLKQGFHIAYIRLSHMYGCSYAVSQMKAFKTYLEQAYGLAAKAALFGFSRGGFYAMRYVAAYPEDAACVYLDAPVIRLTSWPGGKEEGIGSPAEWQDCLAVYGYGEQDADKLEDVSAEAVAALAGSGLPVLIVAGLADEVVPYPENGAVLVQALDGQRQGTPAEKKVLVILRENVGHHPHSLEDPAPIVEFVKGCF
ncbi:MAG: alpha/beta hydrolase fold [Paenibacillaceae bacterium]|jgi:lysophospholipase L1-like esterase/pimeloyl-ACP methyl ester carboxylesterase|nr:alpha/beta hydrolase fold [Paenibacillaceae bacterium]